MKKITLILSLIFTLSVIACNGQEQSPIEDSNAFVEIFHGIELLYTNDYFNDNQVQYLDYLLQKYQLWNRDNIEKYKKKKELLQTDDEKRHAVQLQGQKFKPSKTWKQEYPDIENDSETIFLEKLQKTNPDLYNNVQDLLNDDIKKAEEAFQKIYPGKPFPKDEWSKQQELGKRQFRQVLRNAMRQNFEQNLTDLRILLD